MTSIRVYYTRLQIKVYCWYYVFSSAANVLQKRMINDKLIQFERAFIDCEGLPGRPMYKWVQLSLTMVLVYIQLIDHDIWGYLECLFIGNHYKHMVQRTGWNVKHLINYFGTILLQSLVLHNEKSTEIPKDF